MESAKTALLIYRILIFITLRSKVLPMVP